jgi:TolB protein
MIRLISKVLLALALCVPICAKAELVVDITQGQFRPIPIAITNFGEGAPLHMSSLGQEMTQVIINDLIGTGLFDLVDPNAYIQKGPDVLMVPRFQDWRILNSEALLGGQVSDDGDNIRVEFRLFDVFAERQLEGLAMSSSKKDWRRLAHTIADVIYERLTGDKGYFRTQIVYVSERGPQEKRSSRLAVMDQDGENHHYLTSGNVYNDIQSPHFSPDGKSVAYLERGRDRNTHVRVMNLRSGDTSVLGPFKGIEVSPQYSPDGQNLAMSIAEDGTTSIYEYNIPTKKLNRLTKALGSIDVTPYYSPDGSKIVYVSDQAGAAKLYIKDRNFSVGQRITFNEGSYQTPVWSPRGDLIAFTRRAHGQFYLGVMNTDGTGERMLAKGFYIDSPEWAPNGRRILYTRQDTPGGPQKLFSIDATGYKEVYHQTPEEGTFGTWSPLIPD